MQDPIVGHDSGYADAAVRIRIECWTDLRRFVSATSSVEATSSELPQAQAAGKVAICVFSLGSFWLLDS